MTTQRHWSGLGLAVILAGIASILLRQDSSWDLMNYHYYNAWAFVHGRHGLDWAPAQLQSFYSPFLDLPFYAMVAADLPSRVIAFLLAIPTGVSWYCCARIALTLFESRAQRITAIAIGVTAPMSVSLIGTTMNDWYTAAFVMTALWLVVRKASSMRLVAAGALVGLGAGFKLTGSIYCVGLVAAVVFMPGTASERVRRVAGAGVAMVAGFALTAGPWILLLLERYGNPLFPYYNNIFLSPWSDPVTFSATRFGPTSVFEWIAFPFVLLWKTEGFVSEPAFRDARPALLYLLALASLALSFVRRPRPPVPRNDAWRFLGVFFVASIAAWAIQYRIFRYLVPLELLAGLFIVRFVTMLAPARVVPFALATAFALVVVTAKYPTWWRQKFDDHFLTVTLPPVKPDAIVLLVTPEPMSYVLPSFPRDARFFGLVSNFNDPDRRNRLQETIARGIREHKGPLYALAVPPGRNAGADALAKVGLVRDTCAEIRTNLRASPLELCELRRT